MENTISKYIDVEIEVYKEDLDYLKEHNIDLSEFVRDEINKLMDGSPISELRLEAMKLRQCIEECEERLEDIEKEIGELQKSSV